MGADDAMRKSMAEIQAKMEQGWLPPEDLCAACATGKLHKLQKHKHVGGDLQVKGPDGDTGLHKAAGRGELDVVRYLLENGCEAIIDCRGNNSMTPLMYAARNFQIECAWLLLQSGADPTLKGGRENLTAEGLAHENGKAKTDAAKKQTQAAKKAATAKVEVASLLASFLRAAKIGSLNKKGGIRPNWLKRRFVLDKDRLELRYYDDAWAQKGSINLRGAHSADCFRRSTASGVTAADNELEIELLDRTYRLRAENDGEVDSWVEALRDACNLAA